MRLGRKSILSIPVGVAVLVGLWATWTTLSEPAGPADLPLRVESEHYVVFTDLGRAALEPNLLFFEGFWRVFEQRYFPVEQPERLRLFLYGDPAAYRRFARRDNGREDFSPYGYYRSSDNRITVNLRSGLGTATHELVHRFVHVGFPSRPPRWVDEGLASFFEKFMGHVDDRGQLHISFGYFSNWRFPDTRSRLGELSLRKLAFFSKADQGAARALMLYLHRRGLLRTFILRARDGCRSDCLDELAEVTGRDLDALQQEWKTWIAEQVDERDIGLVPYSFVKSAPDWKLWWNTNRRWLAWSEEQQRYLPRAGDSETPAAPQ